MIFTGTYEHTIDAKNRLAIPRDLRSQLQRSLGAGKGDTIALYAVPGGDLPSGVATLRLYTEPGFEQRAAELDRSQLDAEELLDYEEILFSLAKRVEIDKQGRVLLPQSLIDRAGLSPDVVLLGVKDHLAVRDRASWSAYVERKLSDNPRLLMNPRQAMRSKGPVGS